MGNRVKRYLEGFLLLAAVMLLCAAGPVQAEAAEPSVTKAVLINEYYIELHWSTDVTGADARDAFTVKLDGQTVTFPQNDYRNGCDGTYIWTGNGVLYYDQKTTLCLNSAITDFSKLPKIEVEIAGNKIKDSAGNYVPRQTLVVDTYEPYYTQKIVMDCGVKILGSAKVRPEAMTKAAELMKVVLANESIAKRMGEQKCMLCLYGEGENAYDITAHRFSYDKNMLYVEGFGGTQAASIRDANVLRLLTGDYQTGYRDENILVHEFGHTVKNYGLTEEKLKEWDELYARSIASGKWANSYAGSNSDEFFATLSAIWFNVMNESWDGDWDGVRGPINTRTELKAYDREAYDFMSQVYVSDEYLPDPWKNGSVENNHPYVDPELPKAQEALQTLVDAAKKLNPEDYTKESWDKLQAVLADAEETAKKEDVTADDLKAAKEAVADAMRNLAKPTPTPTPDPTDTPTPEPTDTPTPEPTDTPTPDPTDTPTPEPTDTPTPDPTDTPTPEPTGTPTPNPTMPTPVSYKVSFYNGSSVIATKQVREGQAVSAPVSPKKAGYTFTGWYQGTAKYNFTKKVTGDLKLTAKWKKVTVKAANIKKLTPKKKTAVVTIKKVSKADGYKVTYCKKKNFKKGVKTKFVKKNKVTLKKMKKGTWYVRVQAYKLDSTGEKVYGKVSKAKRVKIK